VFFVGALAASVLILVAWFPAAALLTQRRALAATSGQLNALLRQDQALAQERRALNDPAEIQRLARQQYQLVSPGEQAYQVLPPSSAAGGASAAAPYPGDPGNQAPVAPSAATELPPGASATTTTTVPATSGTHPALRARSAPTPAAGPHPAPGFWQRVAQTLEFWR